jgi:3-oxoacyl-[acyl-carrier-protein] synthase-3
MAYIHSIDYYLPKKELSNKELSSQFPEWNVEKISSKTGISKRFIAADDEFASDMGIKAANKLFEKNKFDRSTIDFLIYCTQSPDYLIPTTACIIQDKLNLRKVGAFDFNLGCSGYIYGLSIAKGLIAAGIAENILFITAETYSKFINVKDKSNRTIFGDAASASIITKDKGMCRIGDFELGSDGSGYDNLIVRSSGVKGTQINNQSEKTDEFGNIHSDKDLYMNGPEIFNFTGSSVPNLIHSYLSKVNLSLEQIDLFVFHQANKFMLNYLKKKTKIPEDKFILEIENSGNTVSSTIPIALCNILDKNKVNSGSKVLLAGFGVGYSWGATLLDF